MKLPPGLPDAMARVLTALPAIKSQPRRPSAAQRAEDRGEAAADPLDEALAHRLERQLILPIAHESEEETSRAAVQDYGQFLARQDRWDELAEMVRDVDLRRETTPSAMSHAELLCYGARADVVQAAIDAVRDGIKPSLDGIEALEQVLLDAPDDYALAVIVAMAHIEIAWAWRGTGWAHEIPERNLRLFDAHFERAATILDLFAGRAGEAPLLAAARCALMAGRPQSKQRLADEYEALIALNPLNPRPMRAMGTQLLPRWHGSYDMLELEARRTAALTADHWGEGGYAWVFMDALTVDPSAARILDLDFFVDGMRDILSTNPDQHNANMLAAFAAIRMDPTRTPERAPDVQRLMRATIFETLDWILAEYLCELHPMVWAEAALPPDYGAPLPMRKSFMRRGVLAARRAIARHFADELMSGTTIAFSPHGLRFFPGSR